MSKNKKNKVKKSKSKSKSKSMRLDSPIVADMVEFVRNRVADELADQRSEIESIVERISEGDASANEIVSVLNDVMAEIAEIVLQAQALEEERTELLSVGE